MFFFLKFVPKRNLIYSCKLQNLLEFILPCSKANSTLVATSTYTRVLVRFSTSI